jgi:small conductance mechanosensitive channel
MENQFAVGDVIEIEGVSGVVERMTLRVVMIRDGDGVLHIIPNGSIPRVSNKTRGWARSVVDIPVSYREQVDSVMRDGSMVIRAVATTWPGRQWDVGREFRRRIKNRLDDEGVGIALPQRPVHLSDAQLQLLAPRGENKPTAGS